MSRWAPLTGVIFVALWIVIAAFVIAFGSPVGSSEREIVAYYADETNRGSAVTLCWLILGASLVFIGFLGVLRDRMGRAIGTVGSLPALSYGLVAAALWMVAGVLSMGVAYTENETKEFVVDPNTERLLSELAYLFFVTGTFAALLVVLATSMLARRTGVLPRWLAWLGLVVAVTMLGALAVLPFLFFLGWVLLVSIVLISHPARSQ